VNKLRISELLRARRLQLLALGVVAVGAFVKLTSELREGELDAFDRTVLLGAASLRTPHANAMAVDLTALGSVTVITMVVLVVSLFLYLERHRRELLQLLLASIGGAVWTALLKNVLERERPSEIPRLVEVAGFSYPSGHSLTSAAVYLTLAFLACHRLRTSRRKAVVIAVALTIVASIGFSRAYLGVHYPTDVAAGLLLGSGWALLVAATLRRAELED
jgi:undecaprenyl-diphosphatase